MPTLGKVVERIGTVSNEITVGDYIHIGPVVNTRYVVFFGSKLERSLLKFYAL